MASRVASIIDVQLGLQDKMSSKLNSVNKSLEAHSKVWNRTAKKLKKTGDSIAKAGTKLTKTVTAGIVAAGVASVKAASDYEDALAKVSTLVDTNSVSMNDMSSQIIELSNKTGVAATDLSEAVYQALSASVDAADAVGFVEQANKLAKGGFTDTASAVDVMTTAINAYGMSASQAEHVADMLITTQNLGKTTVNELASSLGNAIPMAAATSTNMENLSAAMSILTKNGIDTATSATALKGMFSELSKAGTKVSDTLIEKTGKSYTQLMQEGKSLGDIMQILSDSVGGDATAFKNLWSNTRAAQAGITLFNTGTQEFNETLASMQDNVDGAAGATENAYNTMMGTLSSKLEVLKQNFQNFGITVGNKLTPFIETVSEKLKALGDWFNNLSDDQVDMIIKIAGVVAAIGPALVVIGKVIAFIPKLINGFKMISNGINFITGLMSTNPTLLIIGAVIAAIVILGIIIYKNWDKIKPVLDKVWAKVKEVWKKIKPTLQALWEKIKEIWENNIKPTLIALWEKCKEIWEKVKPVLIASWEKAKEIGGKIKDGIKNLIEKIKNFKEKITTTVQSIKEKVQKFIQPVIDKFDAVKNAIQNVIDKLSNSKLIKWMTGNYDTDDVGQNASGTNYWKGGLTWVNEKGGEIMNLPRGTQIIPHDESLKQAYKMGQNSTTSTSNSTVSYGNTTISIPKLADTIVVREDADIDRIAEALANQLKSTASGYGRIAV